MSYSAYTFTTMTFGNPKDLDIYDDLECLLVPTNAQIETLYDKYADEITKPLDFEER